MESIQLDVWSIEQLGCFAGKRGLAGADCSNDRDSLVGASGASRNLLKSTRTRLECEHLSFPWRRGIERVVNRGSSAKRSIGRFQGGRSSYGGRPAADDHDSGFDCCLCSLARYIVITEVALLRIFRSARGIWVSHASDAGHVCGSGDSSDSCLVPAFCNLHLQPIRPTKKIFQTAGHG